MLDAPQPQNAGACAVGLSLSVAHCPIGPLAHCALSLLSCMGDGRKKKYVRQAVPLAREDSGEEKRAASRRDFCMTKGDRASAAVTEGDSGIGFRNIRIGFAASEWWSTPLCLRQAIRVNIRDYQRHHVTTSRQIANNFSNQSRRSHEKSRSDLCLSAAKIAR